jgi:hypothetical protein
MLPPPPPDTRLAELDAILHARRDLVQSADSPNGATEAPRRPPHRAGSMIAAANSTPDMATRRSLAENERMAVIEGAREREMVLAAERYAELAYLRAKGAA